MLHHLEKKTELNIWTIRVVQILNPHHLSLVNQSTVENKCQNTAKLKIRKGDDVKKDPHKITNFNDFKSENPDILKMLRTNPSHYIQSHEPTGTSPPPPHLQRHSSSSWNTIFFSHGCTILISDVINNMNNTMSSVSLCASKYPSTSAFSARTHTYTFRVLSPWGPRGLRWE